MEHPWRWAGVHGVFVLAMTWVSIVSWRFNEVLLRAAADRSEELARVSVIVEYSDEAIVGLSPELLVTSWNAGAERLYGYEAAEAIGRHVSFLTPGSRQNRSTVLE